MQRIIQPELNPSVSKFPHVIAFDRRLISFEHNFLVFVIDSPQPLQMPLVVPSADQDTI
jgi:hypothetical protein